MLTDACARALSSLWEAAFDLRGAGTSTSDLSAQCKVSPERAQVELLSPGPIPQALAMDLSPDAQWSISPTSPAAAPGR